YEVDFDHQGFEWIDFTDYSNSIVSFIRKAKDPEDFIVCVFNFTPVPRTNYRVGVPKGGFYKELLNSDSERFWGSNVGNWGGFNADDIWWQGKPFSLNLQVPPLGAVFMKPYREETVTINEQETREQEAKEQQAAREHQAAKETRESATAEPVTLQTEPTDKTVKGQTKPADKK
ncbi:MAG: alpha amylase C-terminal domain-containing protein, partial [Nitrospirae bacterium]|nr:alpha amylase C-terminal domain-containing protein [Nitrospirota bacterium]